MNKKEDIKILKKYKQELTEKLIANANNIRNKSLDWKKQNDVDDCYDRRFAFAKNVNEILFPVVEQEDNLSFSNDFLIAYEKNDLRYFTPYPNCEIFKEVKKLRGYVEKCNLIEDKRAITLLISEFVRQPPESEMSPFLLEYLGIDLEYIKTKHKELTSLQLAVDFLIEIRWFRSIIKDHAIDGIHIHDNYRYKESKKEQKILQNRINDPENTNKLFTLWNARNHLTKLEEKTNVKSQSFFNEISSIHNGYFCNVCYNLDAHDFNVLFIKSKSQLLLIISMYVFLYKHIFEIEKQESRNEKYKEVAKKRRSERRNEPNPKLIKYQNIQSLKAQGLRKMDIHRKTGYHRDTISSYWETRPEFEKK